MYEHIIHHKKWDKKLKALEAEEVEMQKELDSLLHAVDRLK